MNGTFQGKVVNLEINDGTGWQPLGDVNNYKFQTVNVPHERTHPTPIAYEFETTFTPSPIFGRLCECYFKFRPSMPPNRYAKFMYRAHQRERDKRYQRRARREQCNR